jgi:hypothetical protein
VTVVEVTYAEGWNRAACTAREVITGEQAAERDAAGLPYVVVFHVAERAAPVEVRLVSWMDHYLGVWAYDEQGRRIAEFDLRLLDDARLLRRYTDGREYHGSDEDCDRVTLELFPDGKAVRVTNPSRSRGGGALYTHPDIDDEQRWSPKPEFGDWALFTADRQRLSGPLVFQDAAVPEARRAGEGADDWRPPRPALPHYLDALFLPGTRLSTEFEPMTVLNPRRIGTVRIPSGRLVVDCPATGVGRELTVKIPPGEYVVEGAWTSYEYDFMGKHVEAEDCIAVRLRVSDEPVTSWEMGLAQEDDIRLLRDGHAYGFSTDVAAGGFADAVGWPVLCEPFREPEKGNRPPEQLGDGFLRTTDEAHAADLVWFPTGGDGTYAVWVGRGSSGNVASVVVETAYGLGIEVL